MRYFWFLLLSLLTGIPLYAQLQPPALTAGVSHRLALYRKQLLSEIHYRLNLQIPADPQQELCAAIEIEFKLQQPVQAALPLDFKPDRLQITQLLVNGKAASAAYQKEHLLLPPSLLRRGFNRVTLQFVAGNAALNRRPDYLYTLFVPDRARTVFPCFDQPDLKARFELQLVLPIDYQAISNAPLLDSCNRDSFKIYRFQPTTLLPTYLFGFAAGKFSVHEYRDQQGPTRFLYRETDSAKIAASLDTVGGIHRQALKFLEDWTGIRQPFPKTGMVAIPDFQFGGMEHPGAILFQQSSLLLDTQATRTQQDRRVQLIGHELAHLWFGDLVTMKWFNDVWMKEVFANFLADKIASQDRTGGPVDLRFLTTHLPAAYGVDRSAGTHSIRQQLDNLQDAGMLYGPIIYHKAPVIMRQLERLMGPVAFRKGVAHWLKQYPYDNASWEDLIAVLNRHTPLDLDAWNQAWVNRPGRPLIEEQREIQNGRILKMIVRQQSEDGRDGRWPQLLELQFYYPDSVRTLTLELKQAAQEIEAVKGWPVPLFVCWNTDGAGYGVFPADSHIADYFDRLRSPVTRASTYINLFERAIGGRGMKPAALLDFLQRQLCAESEELNLGLITAYIRTIYWQYLNASQRDHGAAKLETSIWSAILQQQLPGNRKQLFDCYQAIFSTQQAWQRLYGIWQTRQGPAGLELNPQDYTSLALALAMRSRDNAAILRAQQARITDPDRQRRFAILRQAVSSDSLERARFFEGLAKASNRRNEAAVGAALGYLFHPLQGPPSPARLQRMLELLETVQQTGDIFFPDLWLQQAFRYCQDAAVLELVDRFLQKNPDYHPVLQRKIRIAIDPLRRAVQLSNPKPGAF